MSQSKLAKEPARPHTRKNLNYISNFRSSLTALVIVHHTACSYGGIGNVGYQSRFNAQGSSAALIGFNALNQSFFMGSFMFLGGHFSQQALDRKPVAQLVKDRLWRLGLPTVLYTLVGPPLCSALARVARGHLVDSNLLVEHWKSLRGIRGPTWFTGSLLVFDLLLAAMTVAKNNLTVEEPSDFISTKSAIEQDTRIPINLYATLGLCSAIDFAFRIQYPVGACVPPLNVQPAYISQYIAAYIYGASTLNIEETMLSTPTAWTLATLSGVTTVLLANSVQRDPTGMKQMLGGWNKTAAYYAVWNNVTGYFVTNGLLTLFKKYGNQNWGRVNDYAYPAFLLHMPVLSLLGPSLDGWELPPVLKTMVVGSAAVVLSWGCGFVATEVWKAVTRTDMAVVSSKSRS